MKQLTTLIIGIFTLLLSSLGHTATMDTPVAANPNDYALVFFFRSDCPYCHQFAPKLKQLAAQTGTYTYAFSLDNQGIAGFEVPIPSTPDIAATFFENPRSVTVPATFLINVNTRKFVRLTVGDVTSSQLQQSYLQSLNDPQVIASMR
ncbi:type-F conjugative transfer system pilin assembly thiol-disulfide isomerase TrbB [Shewanella sp. PP-He15 brown]|uniref:Type-F conjugative transfer system pilin assembly thiol-disulfide isomerase TrbB n=1 Tax=Shewanella septentrionalis TaxID=2952223 RepID=A0A9X2WZ91_9GAMM|nr:MULTISPECIES: type-F conjugative transfer system pilin assembly thiol-disulfide isomerase TrbB [Shewanella]EHC04209.1 type-F conjugative transfer system pilin assembly thiol-disulfide isomerase TrbB [Shewanella baltica OS625]MCT7948026.1 type-F conjugative transfer system pilin assembly thiol-disulfide isomerase TrbB [Shewanella septentrionalis]